MAHHKSAIKRIRTNEIRRVRNQANRTFIRNEIKKFRGLLDSGSVAEARTYFPTLSSNIFKAVSKNIFRQETASRRVSRLAKALNRAEAAQG